MSQITFFDACSIGDITVVQELLDCENVNPQFANNEPLEIALRNGHFDIVQLLLKDPRVLQDTVNLVRISIAHVVVLRSCFS